MELSWDSVPVPAVLEQVERGSLSLQGLAEIMEGRLALQNTQYTFSQTVSTKSLHELEVRKSSSERTMGFLKNYYLYLAMEQLKQQRSMKESVVGKLAELRASRSVLVQRNKALIENSCRDVSYAGEMLNKAKSTYIKARQECAQQREKLAACERAVEVAERQAKAEAEAKQFGAEADASKKGKSFSKMLSAAFESTPETERDRQEKRVGKRVHELIAASADIKTKKAILTEKISVRDFSIQQAVHALQDGEAARLQSMKQIIGEFCSLERSILTEQSRLLKLLEDTVAEQAPAKDMSDFIAQEKRPEATLKYAKALALLDWDFQRREGDSNADALGAALFEDEESFSAAAATEEDALQAAVWRDWTPADKQQQAAAAADVPAKLSAQLDGAENIELTDGQGPASPRSGASSNNSSSNNSSPNAPAHSSGAISPIGATAATPSAQAANQSLFPPISLSPCPASLECQQTLSALRTIFPSEAEAGTGDDDRDRDRVCDYSESQWGIMMEQPEARELFLQALDEKRGSALLSRRSFDVTAMALTAVLNASLQSDDIKSAMRVANMSNTFYCEAEAGEASDAESDDSLGAAALASASADAGDDAPPAPAPPSAPDSATEAGAEAGTAEAESNTPASSLELSSLPPVPPAPSSISAHFSSDRKKYLQREPAIRHHKLWASDGFWEKAFMEGVGEQMALRKPARWEDLGQEALREAVIGELAVLNLLAPPRPSPSPFPLPFPRSSRRCAEHRLRAARGAGPVDARAGAQGRRD